MEFLQTAPTHSRTHTPTLTHILTETLTHTHSHSHSHTLTHTVRYTQLTHTQARGKSLLEIPPEWWMPTMFLDVFGCF